MRKLRQGLAAAFLALGLSLNLCAAVVIPAGSLAIALVDGASEKNHQFNEKVPAAIAALLKNGVPIALAIDSKNTRARDSRGRWNPNSLQVLLDFEGPYFVLEPKAALAREILAEHPDVKTTEITQAIEAARLVVARGLPKIAFVENHSSVDPLSKDVRAWGWPHAKLSFSKIEKNPNLALKATKLNLVFFSSPGWWDDFPNPPSGPSRMPENVLEALRDYVWRGGSAHFFDIAQWDLESAWPKSVSLANPGPPQAVDFNNAGSNTDAKLALSNNGAAADALLNKKFKALFYSPAFPFADGKKREAYAAYVGPDPNGGRGLVFGQSYDPLPVDLKSVPAQSKIQFLNMLVLAGSQRLTVLGEPRPLQLGRRPVNKKIKKKKRTLKTLVPTPRATPTRMVKAKPILPTPSPQATAIPPTLPPTPAPPPTIAPVRVPPTATRLPSLSPSPVLTQTVIPTLVFLPRATQTLVPTPLETKSTSASRQSTIFIQSIKAAPTVILKAKVRDRLGCLENSPQPFGAGGTYVIFCLKAKANVILRVFNTKGELVREMGPTLRQAGRHQWYYDGRQSRGKSLRPGEYYYQIIARFADKGHESQQSVFDRRKEKSRRR